MNKVTILGAGTWGMALARMLCTAGSDVAVWSALPTEVEKLGRTRRHPNLPGVEIPRGIRFVADLGHACEGCGLVVVAVPSPYVRQAARGLAPHVVPGQIMVVAAKGIEPGTLMTMSEVISSELPGVPVVALSGPTHAEEVARDLPTAIVAACGDVASAEEVQRAFSTDCVRVYTNPDVRGVELCGALKNVFALAAGISAGMGYGDNARAALVTRGLAEMARLGEAMGCLPETFSGLAGLGDLVVTATSAHSRNNRCGYLIGQGHSPADAVRRVGMVVEGVNALPAAVALAERCRVDMPIVAAVDAVVTRGADPREAVRRLMGREGKTELPRPVMDLRYEAAVARNALPGVGGETGMKRVITYGTFDLLHYGHINLLRRAKALGDYLIVAISTDEFNWNEKRKRCYFTWEQRKALVEAVRYVDLVIPEEGWAQKRSDVREYHVDTFVMGDDWRGKFDFLEEEGVEVVYLPRTPEISSSKMKSDLNGVDGAGGESRTSHEELDTDPR